MHYSIANVRESWREWFRRKPYDIEYQRGLLDKVIAIAQEDRDNSGFDLAEEIRDEMMENIRKALKLQEAACPIGFFRPSWEQAQVLNAWHPDFEPDLAPQGYRSVCMFCGNRIGKTAISVVNTLLWFLPNDTEWLLFEEMEDQSSKKRGKYRVHLRPQWDLWRRTGKLHHVSDLPPMTACECWHGVENDIAWHDKVGKEYIKWMPLEAIGRRSDGGSAIFKQERKLETKYGHSITGKTFNADVQDWAGKAVRILNLDEGLSKNVLTEALLRIEAGGYLMWPYTPAEPRNVGDRSRVAHDAYSGKIDLVGKPRFFMDFSMEDAPDYIIPPDKKRDDIARLSREGEMGRVRMKGGFFQSSPTVFSNFERERNVLPVDAIEVLLAIRGETPERWRKEFGQVNADRMADRFHGANIVRGMDEGMANPTACTWDALLPGGEYVTFREWEQAGLSVSERCAAIIDRSGNRRQLLKQAEEESRSIYREEWQPGGMKIRRTFADSKMFRRNQEMPQDDWTESYRKAGLKLERATSIGPAARCDYFNDMLRAESTRQHLVRPSEPGCRAYITRDCPKLIERMENYLWQQIAQGQRAGEFTDKPENKDDHTVDAACYVKCSKLRWLDPESQTQPQAVGHRSSVTGYVSR